MIGEQITQRLRMRQWSKDDFEDFCRFFSDPVAARFVGGSCERPTAWRKLATFIGHWQLRGYGFWAVEDKETHAFIGSAGLWMPEGWPELEVGYWIMPEKQGNGYATEAALKAREVAYQQMGVKTLVSYIHPENLPSKRVAERMGAKHETTQELMGFGPHCIYRHPGP